MGSVLWKEIVFKQTESHVDKMTRCVAVPRSTYPIPAPDFQRRIMPHPDHNRKSQVKQMKGRTWT
jgi:hypothetical protein